MNLQTFQNEEDFTKTAANFVAEVCQLQQKSIHIALSGGSSPKTVYKAVAMHPDAPFNNVEIYQVDERYVPPTDAESNQKLIAETFLSNPEKKVKAAHYFDTSLSIEECLQKYEQELPATPLDLAILGIGPDGHTASLFPGLTALDETERSVAYTTTDEFAVFDRLTLTFPPILSAKKLLVLLKGEEKQAIIDELTEGPQDYQEFPAKRLLEHPHLNIFYLQ